MSTKKYDVLIVGAGLFGATIADKLKSVGKSCLVIDRRSEIGGNCATEEINDIIVHKYGPHIFHTSNREVWEYVNKFVKFNSFINQPIAVYHNEVYNMPFNMNTFSQIFGVKTPGEAMSRIEEEKKLYMKHVLNPDENLENKAISLVGETIYKKLVKEYTEKQWGKPCDELPAWIISRLPVRYTYNNNYFNDIYQGIPEDGYSNLINEMLDGTDVILNTSFDKSMMKLANTVVYSGRIDEFFDYSEGKMGYRGIKFNTKIIDDCSNFQGNAVVNYTSSDVPYTRITEHKHFNPERDPNFINEKTVITVEYPFSSVDDPDKSLYPINDEKNNKILKRYHIMSKKFPNVIFGGRLGEYKYHDMDKTIESAISISTKLTWM